MKKKAPFSLTRYHRKAESSFLKIMINCYNSKILNCIKLHKVKIYFLVMKNGFCKPKQSSLQEAEMCNFHMDCHPKKMFTTVPNHHQFFNWFIQANLPWKNTANTHPHCEKHIKDASNCFNFLLDHPQNRVFWICPGNSVHYFAAKMK